MQHPAKLSAALHWLRATSLPLALTLTACASQPVASPPVPKPQNVTASESASYQDWSQKVRDYLRRARESLEGLTLGTPGAP